MPVTVGGMTAAVLSFELVIVAAVGFEVGSSVGAEAVLSSGLEF